MERRKFIRNTALAIGAGVSVSAFKSPAQLPIIKPKSLTKGDTVGLITPSSAISRSSFEKALANISDLGFNVKYSDNMRVRKGFLAGSDAQRVEDLHAMFADTEVAGIICARGGYGSGRLLGMIDYALIRNNPKVFIGYSDITALHYAIYKNAGLMTFHGPVGASDFSDFTASSFEKVVIKGKSNYSFSVKSVDKKENKLDVIASGVAEGQLVGGNLTLMISVLGTPYDLDFDGKLVFIEEIGESPYKIDRMLTQLLNTGKLKKARGIILGQFNDCETKPTDPDYEASLSLAEVFADRLAGLGIPVAAGLPFGHVPDNATIPFGIKAHFDASDGKLTYLESAIQ